MKPLLILFILSLLSACGTTRHEPMAPRNTLLLQESRTLHKPTRSYTPPSNNEAQMNNLTLYAMSLYDTPYRYGGTTRKNGFDCSGFVQYVYKNSLGLSLPRTSAQMSRVGIHLKRQQLRPGDLVFFNTSHRRYSHVGIFIGDNRFLHAPRTGKAIRISSMKNKYWRTRYEGARRMTLNK